MKTIIIAFRVAIVTTLLTGIAYPLLVTALAQVLFPARANGSLVYNEKAEIVGSELIGQSFSNPAYFQGRPSAAGAGYDASASSGSNLGTTSQKLRDRIARDILRLTEQNPGAPGTVPDELVTASASGLDPHLSPLAARWQVPRIASARSVDVGRVQRIVDAYIEGRSLGILGEPRVNVLILNLALDRQFGSPRNPAPSSARSGG